MQINNIHNLFNRLVKDEKSDVHTLEVIHGSMSLWIAELKAGKILPAHYHNDGIEIYQVLDGQGNIELGDLSVDKSVTWKNDINLQPGDILEIKPGVVHRLIGGKKNLKLIFFAPPSHLDSDRVFLDEKE